MDFNKQYIVPRCGNSDPIIQERAHATVYKAVKQGALQRAPCRVCGKEETLYTHTNYFLPTTTGRWYCRRHLIRFRWLLYSFGIEIPGSPRPSPSVSPMVPEDPFRPRYKVVPLNKRKAFQLEPESRTELVMTVKAARHRMRDREIETRKRAFVRKFQTNRNSRRR